MRKIVVTEFISLDGVVEDPGGAEGFKHGGWSFKFNDPAGMKFKLSETLESEALLLGRVTYEGFAEAWPERTDEVGFADKMNAMPKYVVSSTLKRLTWNNSTLVGLDQLAELKAQDGGDILVAGSISLVNALLEADLIDELRLMVHPVVLGSGKRLFTEHQDAHAFKLAEARALDSGSLILRYALTEQL
ncbi:MAG TPA: dihydrofolate reductase family protein [Solirubrobacteraceae bacterium]|nr:dihydrofolate reductase family protein [Solirubrobacteraceae bacterium]